MATAVKRGLLKEHHYQALIKQLTTLNRIGEQLGKVCGIHAMTDVTGFGLLGHLIEMAQGSKLSVELHYNAVKIIDGVEEYIKQKTIPGATARNWKSYGDRVSMTEHINRDEAICLLPDPQTNGGLLLAVAPEDLPQIQEIFSRQGLESFTAPIGKFVEQNKMVVVVQ
ncbi:MAG: hypothetical protein NVS9B7_30010 [Flavisolibacter sp.]